MDYGEGIYFLGSAGDARRRFEQEAYNFGRTSRRAAQGMSGFELTDTTLEQLFYEFMEVREVDNESLARMLFEEHFLQGWRADVRSQPLD
jgi:hypothetical protein